MTSHGLLQVIFALNQTLLQQESLRAGSLQVPYTTEDLIRHYNCGDLNSIIFSHDTSQASAPSTCRLLSCLGSHRIFTAFAGGMFLLTFALVECRSDSTF